jgi:hypothetical protein
VRAAAKIEDSRAAGDTLAEPAEQPVSTAADNTPVVRARRNRFGTPLRAPARRPLPVRASPPSEVEAIKRTLGHHVMVVDEENFV